MKERACRFGEGARLTGIVTEPTGPRLPVALVLVSAGVTPKFGPFRLYTQLARRLAADGLSTLRFDLGGVGDSPPALDGTSLVARTRREIAAAVDFLVADLALSGVVVGGLCSGAEDAFRYAEDDPRVQGVVLIDPFGYRTAGWRWRNALYRARRRALRLLGAYEPRAPAGSSVLQGRGEKRVVDYKYMPHAESSRILETLAARRTQVHFVYTGGVRRVFNHPGQLRAMFPDVDLGGVVTIDHLPEMEHTQMREEDRRALVEAIARRLAAWVSR